MNYKIGDFARIGRVTVQTLRHYDSLDLLKPASVDTLSGYRYYELDQLPRLNRILALKDLGFSLEQIAHMLEEALPVSEIRGMFKVKKHELQQEIRGQLDRLERLEARLKMIEQEEAPLKYDVLIKEAKPILVASVRSQIPSYWDIGPLWGELSRRIAAQGLQPTEPYLALYHSNEPEIDVEICAPLKKPAPEKQPDLTIRELPAHNQVASIIHHGSYTGLAAAYAELARWTHMNGYRINGPDREIYLRLPKFSKPDDDSAITELQVPMIKADR